MKKFEQINDSAFACLKTKLSSQGINLEGDAGYLSKNGISLDYAYDAAAATLTISNLEVGFPASMIGMNDEKVLNILDKAIAECRG
jgi:hypothetical protein